MKNEHPTKFAGFYDLVEGQIIALLGGHDRACEYLTKHDLLDHLMAYCKCAHLKDWNTDLTASRWFRKFAKKAARRRNKVQIGNRITLTKVTTKKYVPTKYDLDKAKWRRLPEMV